MTKDEFKLIVKGIKAIYEDPNFISDQFAFNMWYSLLGDLDYKVVADATKKVLQTSHFKPTPAAIREMATKITSEQHENPMEAWSIVHKAICRANYYADEDYNKMPETIQKAVGSPSQLRSWGRDENFNEGVAQSQFIKVYNDLLKREELSARCSTPISQRIETGERTLIDG